MKRVVWAVSLFLVAAAAGVAIYLHRETPAVRAEPVVALAPEPPEASAAAVRTVCAACHEFPAPEAFPRRFWRQELKEAYDFFHDSDLQLDFPPFESTVRFYEARAPESLPKLPHTPADDPACARWTKTTYDLPGGGLAPAVTNVNLVHLSKRHKLDVLVCDGRRDELLLLQPYLDQPKWRTLAHLPAPAHTEVVDLDGDGIPDILVACLGSFVPTDDRVGSVVWLRGRPDGTYQPFTLLENVGRVADVRAADFRGIGKLDLIVGVFGWRNNGEIMHLENRTKDWSHPVFASRVVDDHHGTIHVPVCDLNGDGKPDFVALISQEHEMIVAFVNDGHGHFEREIVYRAPHPAYGSSGIQIVDLNGDGKPDILYSNGDIMDPPPLYKPYHGIQWLENTGGLHFTHHPLEPMYGAMRAVAAKAEGKNDLFAVSWLPAERFPDRQTVQPDAILWLENTGKDHYVRHALEQVTCDHLTCATGDVFGDGRTCLVTGNYYLDARHAAASAVDIWTGPARTEAKPGKR